MISNACAMQAFFLHKVVIQRIDIIQHGSIIDDMA